MDRGAGRPEAAFLIERAMDVLARKLGIDPAELRRRNFIPPENFPYESATGVTYDSGEYETVFLRPVMPSSKDTSLAAHFVLQPV